MRIISILVVAVVIGSGVWWTWQNTSQVKGAVEQYLDKGEFLTLEVRYTPQQIMEASVKEFSKNGEHSVDEPRLKFYPYLLMDVKFVHNDRKTSEGVILWGMDDGEMVMNTETWEVTHGFEDCIDADATRSDFRIINALAQKKDGLTREDLQRELQVENDTLTSWMDAVRKKQLVVQLGSSYRLHLQEPKLNVMPQTKISQFLVTKPYSHATRIGRRYSKAQIRKIAHAAFGSDFAIRSEKEVFLPVYTIEVKNSDGSMLTTYWNALNGQRVKPKYLTMR